MKGNQHMIYINGSILDETPTGLGVYAKYMITKLKNLDANIKVFCAVGIDDIEVVKISRFVKPKYKKLGGLCRFLWTQLVLPFRVNKEDTIYHPFQYLSLFSRSRQIITIHDFIPVQFPEVAKHQFYYYKYIMPHLLKKAEKVICISENTKSDIISFYNMDESKIQVIYNGFDTEQFNDKTNESDNILEKYNIDYKYILMVGASYKHKNLETVIKALKTIEQQCNYKILIIGKESDYVAELKKLSLELELSDRVKFLGYVEGAELPLFYKHAEIFAYPSLYEGFGFPLLEAMACGTAVISSNSSSLPEVTSDSALLFDPRDEKQLADEIVELMTNEALKEELVLKGKQNVQRFSWDYTAEKIYKIIKNN